MRSLVLLTYCRHRPMDARKHRCRILLAASEPVAYRLVLVSFREDNVVSNDVTITSLLRNGVIILGINCLFSE